MIKNTLAAAILLLVTAMNHTLSLAGDAACAPPQRLEMKVLGQQKREQRNFTQGLEIYRGRLLESTGSYRSKTKLNSVSMEGAATVLSETIQEGTFGEGLTVLNDEIYQSTWQNKKMFVFNSEGVFSRTLDFPFIGWGLTNDGKNLITTDGSHFLRFLNPKDLSVIKTLEIKYLDNTFPSVNELEMVKGKIFGNILLSDEIVRINPENGCIDGTLDASTLRKLLPPEEIKYLSSDRNFVLNGIAYDSAKDEFILTGKNWGYLFRVKISN